jgi:hypothetical protein
MGDRSTRPLPHAANASVELRRLQDYLLNVAHPVGGPKARYFTARGFSRDGAEQFRMALVTHGRMNSVTRIVETAWGPRYTVECQCLTPDGSNPCIRTIWQFDDGDTPRLITAIPLRQKG